MKARYSYQLLITLVPATSILFVMMAAKILFQVNISTMTKDVTSVVDVHPFTGILSNFGILLWCVSASICGFSAIFMRDLKLRHWFWFLLSSCLLSMYLLFDDFFLFHEELAPRYLNINEGFIVAFLGVLVLSYLAAFKNIIFRTNYAVLLLSIAFLSTSVIIDKVFESWFWQLGDWEYLIEDGAKWLGIVSWCSYYAHTSYHLLVNAWKLSDRAT